MSILSASASNVGNASEFETRFKITSSRTFELQHRCETSKATVGLGSASNFGTEVYGWLKFLKIA